MKHSYYFIDQMRFDFPIANETCFGNDEILLLQDDDLTRLTDWHKNGYAVKQFLNESLFSLLLLELTDFVRLTIESVLKREVLNFSLENYHCFCDSNDVHLAVIRELQAKSALLNFPISYKLLDQRLSDICQLPVTCYDLNNYASGRFFLRIIRPQQYSDNNPPHRDVWLSHLRNAINIYVPLAGSNQLSSLPIIPTSHFWKESDMERTTTGAIVNGASYNVSSIVSSSYGLKMIRPIVNTNEMMVFSPYLVHGGGVNLNNNTTRVSLEMRFWRK